MRHTTNFKVTDAGRDTGKTFLITELPSEQGEAWAIRAMLAMIQAGVEVPADAAGAGMAGIAAMGLQGLMRVPWLEVKPLLDEMMMCVQIIPDPARPQVVRPLVMEDIEEIATRFKLRKATFDLHTSFLKAGVPSTQTDLTKRPAANAS